MDTDHARFPGLLDFGGRQGIKLVVPSMKVDLTLKNYRCFADDKPVRITIQDGFTALVGPNNSGKSSLLRFFYEFRALFGNLTHLGNLLETVKSSRQGLGLQPPSGDWAEVFHKGNDRDISFKFRFEGTKWKNIPTTPEPPKLDLKICVHQPGAIYSGEILGLESIVSVPTNQFQARGSDALSVIIEQAGAPPEVSLKEALDAFNLFARMIYVGAFRNAINMGSNQAYFDLQVGQAFIQAWEIYKSGGNRQNNEAAARVEADIARMLGFVSLQINPAPENKALQLMIDGKSYPLDDLGAGVAQMIMVLANVAIKKPSFVLLDEPELNLHPSLQLDFLTTLASYATNGIIFATHSIGLARATADQIYSVQRVDSGPPEVRPFDAVRNLPEFLGELGYSGYSALGGAKILLVEGPTDVRAIQQFLRKLRKDHKIIMLPLGGGSMINAGAAHELDEIRRITTDVAVIIDSERTFAGGPVEAGRNAFAAVCRKMGFNICVLEKRALENYFPAAAVKAVLGASHHELTDFQDPKTSGWSKADNWRIAKEMTEADLNGKDLGRFLSSL